MSVSASLRGQVPQSSINSDGLMSAEQAGILTNVSGYATAAVSSPALWSMGTSSKFGHVDQPRVKLADGRIFLPADGNNKGEIYNPTTGTYTLAATFPGIFRRWAFLHLITSGPNSGKVIFAGGVAWDFNSSQPVTFLNDSYLYDPASNSWTATGPLPFYSWLGCVGVTLPSGKVLAIVPGATVIPSFPIGSLMPTKKTYLFDTTALTWSTTGDTAQTHSWTTVVLLPSGKALTAGGRASNPGLSNPSNNVEVYDPGLGTWSSTLMPAIPGEPDMVASPVGGRCDPLIAVLSNGKVLIAGGTYISATTGTVACRNSTLLFDPATLTFVNTRGLSGSDLSVPMLYNRASAGVVLLPDGSTQLLIGGMDVNLQYQAFCELYDPTSDTFTITAQLPALNGNGSNGTSTPLVDFKAWALEAQAMAFLLSTGNVMLFPSTKANPNAQETTASQGNYKTTYVYQTAFANANALNISLNTPGHTGGF